MRGFFKAVTGMDRAHPETIRRRAEVCARCPYRSGSRCRECGCFCHLKVKVQSERCPRGRWR
jgi:hypothetical protein